MECTTEPSSGTNTIYNGTKELFFTFDGSTDCDEEVTQMLSINGGELVEKVCASFSSSRVSSTSVWLVCLMTFLGKRRPNFLFIKRRNSDGKVEFVFDL